MKRLWVIHLPPQRGYQTLAPSGYAHPIPPFSLGGFLLLNLRQSFFRGKIWFNFPMHFPSRIKEFLLLPFMNHFYTLSSFFLAEMFISCSGVAVNSIRLHGNGCLSVGMLMSPPFRPRPPARVPWFFHTKFVLTSSKLKSCTFSSKGLHFFFSVWISTLQKS